MHLAVIARLFVSQPFFELTFKTIESGTIPYLSWEAGNELPLMERTCCPKVVRLRWTSQSPLVSDLVQRPVCFLWMNSPKGGGGQSM